MNYVLDDANAAIASVTWMGSTFAGPNGNVAFDGVPLGITAGGELAAKVLILGTLPASTPPVGTYTSFHVANNGSTTIPTTAKRWAVNYIGTGTANTFGSNTAVTGGQGFSDNASPAASIAVACDGSTVADGFYSTT